MSYISVCVLIILCILCLISGFRKIKDCKKEENGELKNQLIFSAVGLIFFGGIGVIVLLYIIIFV